MIQVKEDIEVIDLALKKSLVKRVAAGSQLSASPKLRSFLLYVADCALREHAEEATEHQIGIKIFGRRPGYNSGDDSIVRSQARLLRQKLTAYFASEGANESVIIEMPKGQYLPVFRPRNSELNHLVDLQPHGVGTLHKHFGALDILANENGHPTLPAAEAQRRSWPGTRTVLLLLAALAAGLITGAWGYRRWSTAEVRKPNALWSPFLAKTRPTVVIYSNPLFRGTPADGLHLVDPDTPTADHELEDETYTGTGEVAAIYQLTRFFDAHDAKFLLKRSRLVTWDEARSGNVIFVGAPSQNTAQHDLPTLSQFSIMVDQAHRGYIANMHPHPGEPLRFPTNDKSQETAIMALIPGLEPGSRMIILSGLTTIGTQAAVEYACRPESVALLSQQAGLVNGELRPFEAVLEVGISKGVGVSAKLLLLHRH